MMHKKRVRVTLAICVTMFLLWLAPGCGGGGKEYSNKAYGCRFSLEKGWKIVEEKERQGILTLQLQDVNGEASSMVITVFPAALFTPDETLAEAEKLLRKGLYELQEPFERGELSLNAGRTIPFLTVQAGRREMVEAGTAVLHGAHFTALVTLIAPREHFAAHRAVLQALLESFDLA